MSVSLNGLKAGDQRITPMCRANRGTAAAFDEAVRRLRESYIQYADDPANLAVTWQLVMVRVEG